MEKEYRNLGFVLLILIPLILLGFYRSYIIQIPHFEEDINLFVHLHALFATVWIFTLIAQPLFIRYKKFKAHRFLGKLSYIIFPLLILSFIPQMLKHINANDYQFLFFPGADSFLLIIFYVLAIINRKKTFIHMRYMIAAAIVFLGPTVGRIGPGLLKWSDLTTQNVMYGIIYIILLSLIFYDKTNQKNYKPYLVALFGFFIHQVIFLIIFL